MIASLDSTDKLEDMKCLDAPVLACTFSLFISFCAERNFDNT